MKLYAPVKVSSTEMLKGNRPELNFAFLTVGPRFFQSQEEAREYSDILANPTKPMMDDDNRASYGPMGVLCVGAPSVTMIYEAEVTEEQIRNHENGGRIRIPFDEVRITHATAFIDATETSLEKSFEIDCSNSRALNYDELDNCLMRILTDQQRLAKGILREPQYTRDDIVLNLRGQFKFQQTITGKGFLSDIERGIVESYYSDATIYTEPKNAQLAVFNRLGKEIVDRLNFTAAVHMVESLGVFREALRTLPQDISASEKYTAACNAVLDNIEKSGWLANTFAMKGALVKIRDDIGDIVKEAERFDEDRTDIGDKADDGSVGENDIV